MRLCEPASSNEGFTYAYAAPWLAPCASSTGGGWSAGNTPVLNTRSDPIAIPALSKRTSSIFENLPDVPLIASITPTTCPGTTPDELFLMGTLIILLTSYMLDVPSVWREKRLSRYALLKFSAFPCSATLPAKPCPIGMRFGRTPSSFPPLSLSLPTVWVEQKRERSSLESFTLYTTIISHPIIDFATLITSTTCCAGLEMPWLRKRVASKRDPTFASILPNFCSHFCLCSSFKVSRYSTN
mmetsp:Transcript_18377/g.46079  ORF Transcript_18377/g.46079 Transcript_18377/m.46079 type:complete len:241 (+) Transcript_18377:1640-2362(+)